MRYFVRRRPLVNSGFLLMWRNPDVVVCVTHSSVDIAESLAGRRCCRRLSCSHPYSVFSVAALAEDSIPRLGSRDSGWNANFWDFQLDPPPGSGHGPMKTDPKYPYTSQCQNGGCFVDQDL